ncbi:Uncharacterised protein [Vibrio cholerae]|nr:Uncharacterised protein [Vibrio cholerae]
MKHKTLLGEKLPKINSFSVKPAFAIITISSQ